LLRFVAGRGAEVFAVMEQRSEKGKKLAWSIASCPARRNVTGEYRNPTSPSYFA
jgi:hypothetical protein